MNDRPQDSIEAVDDMLVISARDGRVFLVHVDLVQSLRTRDEGGCALWHSDGRLILFDIDTDTVLRAFQQAKGGRRATAS